MEEFILDNIVFAICDHRLHNVEQCEMVISELLQNSKDISSKMELFIS